MRCGRSVADSPDGPVVVNHSMTGGPPPVRRHLGHLARPSYLGGLRVLRQDIVGQPWLCDGLPEAVALPVRTLHRRLLSAPWAAKVSHKGWTCSAHPCQEASQKAAQAMVDALVAAFDDAAIDKKEQGLTSITLYRCAEALELCARVSRMRSAAKEADALMLRSTELRARADALRAEEDATSFESTFE